MPRLDHPRNADPGIFFGFRIGLGDAMKEATILFHDVCHFCFDEDVYCNAASTGAVGHGEVEFFDDEAPGAVSGAEISGDYAEFVAGEGVEGDGGYEAC